MFIMNNILHPSDIVCRVRRITNYSKSDFCVVAFDGIHRNKYRPRPAIKSRPAALHLALIMAAADDKKQPNSCGWVSYLDTPEPTTQAPEPTNQAPEPTTQVPPPPPPVP